MKAPFIRSTQMREGWHAVFAFQVFHRPPEEWMKMKWGFNAGALLDEALDRYKLFIESQAVGEIEFMRGMALDYALALRGIHIPGSGVKMVLLGRSSAPEKEEARENALRYALQVYSTFPHDFILMPAETEDAYENIAGEQLLTAISDVAQIQRGMVSVQDGHHSPYLTGLWGASSRSNEQIWRTLSSTPQPALFNILIKPSILYLQERRALREIGRNISEQTDEVFAARVPWIENYVKRRLSPWKKFFLAQVHFLMDGGMEELIRSLGSALTRDSNDLALPGYQVRIPIPAEDGHSWRENIRLLELAGDSLRMDDLADVDEVHSIFRFPYRPEAGLPGANFSEPGKAPDLSLG